MRTKTLWICGLVVLLLVGIQAVPVQRANPPGRGTLEAPAAAAEVADGEMPPWYYLPLHPSARLTAEDRAELRAWLQPGPAASGGE